MMDARDKNNGGVRPLNTNSKSPRENSNSFMGLMSTMTPGISDKNGVDNRAFWSRAMDSGKRVRAFETMVVSPSVGCDMGNQEKMILGLGGMNNQTPQIKPKPNLILPEITEDHPSMDHAEDLLQTELTYLSSEERERVYDDLHGVADVVQEDADFINQKLLELEYHLERILQQPPKLLSNDLREQVEHYEIACRQNSWYVTNRDFRLMFLRSTRYNAKAGAERILFHLKAKADMFGKDMMTRDIQQNDLTDDDMEAVETRFFEFLSVRDRSGRAVCQVNASNSDHLELEPAKRAYWYLAMSLLKDPLTQIKGTVCVINGFRAADVSLLPLTREFAYIDKAVPLFTAATHYCSSDPSSSSALALFRYYSLRDHRMRTRMNIGFGNDNLKYLQSFGIQLAMVGLSHSGEDWIARMSKEELRHRMQRQHRQRLMLRHGGEDGDDVGADCAHDLSSNLSDDCSISSFSVQTFGFGPNEIEEIPQSFVDAFGTSEIIQPIDGVFDTASTTGSIIGDEVACSVSVSNTAEANDSVQNDPDDHSEFTSVSNNKVRVISSGGSVTSNNNTNAEKASKEHATNPIGKYVKVTDTPVTDPTTSGDTAACSSGSDDHTSLLIIPEPKDVDVLFGKGKSRNHPGNMHLHKMVGEDFRAEYERSSRLEKSKLAANIVRMVKQDLGGRFLKHTREIIEEEGAGFGSDFNVEELEGKLGWVEVPNDTAREKVVKMFCKLRGKKKR